MDEVTMGTMDVHGFASYDSPFVELAAYKPSLHGES